MTEKNVPKPKVVADMGAKNNQRAAPRQRRNASEKPRFPSREAAKQETREALINAAIDLFKESGLDSPSLDAVCARAGYTRGAFYVHFKTRDELIAAVMEHVGIKVIDSLLGPESSPPDNLQAVMGRFLTALMSGEYPLSRAGGIRPYQLMDACARSPEVRTRFVQLAQDSVARLQRIVERSQAQGTLRADVSPQHLAMMLLYVVIGVQSLSDLEVPLDLASSANELFKLVVPHKPA